MTLYYSKGWYDDNMNTVMLVSYYRTYTHFFQRNLIHLGQLSPYLDDRLRIYSTHNYLESTKEEFAGSIRFSLVRDPIECITSSVVLDATAGKLTPKRIAYVIDEWIDFHTKLLEEDQLTLVWCNDLKTKPLKTFIKIAEIVGIDIIRDTVIEQKDISDFNYLPSKKVLSGYDQAFKAVSAYDLSKAYKIYSKLVKQSLVI